MHAHMGFQGVVSAKGLSTSLTLVTLFSGMDSLVIVQGIQLSEGFSTVLALMWSFPSVDQTMLFVEPLIAESFATLSTYIWLTRRHLIGMMYLP